MISSTLVKPSVTPVTRFCTSVRCMPQNGARAACVSLAGLTRIAVLADVVATISSRICSVSVPLGPFTDSDLALDGRGDARGQRRPAFYRCGTSEHLRQHFAADILRRALRRPDRTPRGVETMVMPRPLRTRGSSRAPE